MTKTVIQIRSNYIRTGWNSASLTLVLSKSSLQRQKLDSVTAARHFFLARFASCDQTKEYLWIAHLDQQCLCIHLHGWAGDHSSVRLPIRAVVASILEHDSSAVLLAHNHPSGNPAPSASDCQLTRRLVLVADALDCRVLDHLIFVGASSTSLRELGLL